MKTIGDMIELAFQYNEVHSVNEQSPRQPPINRTEATRKDDSKNNSAEEINRKFQGTLLQ